MEFKARVTDNMFKTLVWSLLMILAPKIYRAVPRAFRQ